MFFWRDLVLLLTCFLTDVIVFRDYLSEKETIYCGDIKQQHSYDLVVGILSARRNFNLRESLRETWVGNVKKQHVFGERILVKFIISDKACMIPPEYRTDPHKCGKRLLKDLDFDKKLIAYQAPRNTQANYFASGPVGRDFSVLFPIVLTSLGVSESGLDKTNRNTIVRVYDKIAKKEIVNATFTVNNPGTLVNGSWFKTVPNYILPKNFQASIVTENFNHVDPTCNKPEEFVEIQDGGGLIITHKARRFGDSPGVFPEQEETIYDGKCPYAPGTFIYLAHVSDYSPDVSSTQEKEVRFREWKTLKDAENIRLLKESEQFSDILFVPNVDVYRNLPSQVLEFYRWVSKNLSFTFTLKTDDDCFVDIEGILKAINVHKLRTKSKVWWSRFRTDWLVDRQGKWAEPDYPGVSYPTFACGAGNVLSADLVHWLARNADSLKRYQGEDVSLGIWLSAVSPTIYKDQRWSCFQECFTGMFTSPEQDTESLQEMWENFQSCGNPCAC